MRTLREHGCRALFAGGCVRDELLGREPTDYDVATDATPDRIKELFRFTGEVGKAFGVMLVREEHAVVEVATFRADGEYTDKRRPDTVVFSGEVEDARRRDFTINALFLDPLDDEAQEVMPESGVTPGRVIDHVGGLADLGRRQIRAVGVAADRFNEDHLRALRAIRFACRLGFTIEDSTRRAIAEQAQELAGVSRERIGDELRRMLSHPTRARAAILLEELGLDAPVLGEEPVGKREGKCEGGGSLVAVGREGGEIPMAVALAGWLLDRGGGGAAGGGSLKDGLVAVPAVVRRVRSRLILSNDERDLLRATLDVFFELERSWVGLSVAGRKRLIARQGFRGALGALAGRDAELCELIRREVVELGNTPQGIAPEPILTGDDLIGLGLSPGPGFARLLNQVYDEQLEGRVVDRAGAEEFVRHMNG